MPRVTLDTLRAHVASGEKFAMLTAYDYPMGCAAHAAGIPVLLVGDSAAMVVLGHDSTRDAPLDFLVTIANAVRRGAPDAYLVGDMPYAPVAAGPKAALDAARRFVDAGCDAVKLELRKADIDVVRPMIDAGIPTIVHLGLRPQEVSDPRGYKSQARDAASIEALVDEARTMVSAGAVMILLEAIPPEASAAVKQAVHVPVIGCGAGPACDGFVVVTHDLLGLTTGRVPRFVPVVGEVFTAYERGMRAWREMIRDGTYPADEHNYRLRSDAR